MSENAPETLVAGIGGPMPEAPFDLLQKIYGWISDVNNTIMTAKVESANAMTILKGDNGHGLLARVDALAKRQDEHDLWTREYLATREATCPVAQDIAALREYVDKRDRELKEARASERDARTKLLIAAIGLVGAAVGGIGVAIFKQIWGMP